MELPPPPPEWPRERIPKDGPGPRGVPDIYYTSRVLNSTGRYARFVRKLRQTEEEERKGNLNKQKELLDQQTNDFFIRCDRRSLVNNVARRVDLCLRSYDEDLQKKRDRLRILFNREEEENIRKFVEQAQAGVQARWQEKMERLEYLLAKRKKEHEDKYKDTPISKAAHVMPCLFKLRAKEAQEIQLYQMREKQAMKLAEREFDKMWHAVAMKESEALAARMELDEIERYRRTLDCKEYGDYQIAMREKQRQIDREMLKKEQLAMKAKFDEEERKELEAERQRHQKRMDIARETAEMAQQQKEIRAKQDEQAEKIREAWDSLSGQGIAEDKAKIAMIRQKNKEQNECNKKMIELRKQWDALYESDQKLVEAAYREQQEIIDQKRCAVITKSRKTTQEVHQGILEQIKENQEKRARLRKEIDDQNEYFKQLRRQQDELFAYKKIEDKELMKLHQEHLREQSAYNALLKERAKAEEEDQQRKGHAAAKDYEDEIQRMLCRRFVTDEIHPFMKQMAKGLNMRGTCYCAKRDYCK